MNRRLDRKFYQRDAVTVARALLGQLLVRRYPGDRGDRGDRDRGRGRLTGVIVETEAYLGVADKAAHTAGGRRTIRNASMWGDGGLAYIYFTYGMHHCVNVVAGRCEEPVAVLLRALEPVEGIKTMFSHRPKARLATDLCSGPAKLAQALAIDRHLDGSDLTQSSELFIERLRRRTLNSTRIGVGPRIGVGYAGDWADKPLRFFVRDSRYVSRR